MRELSRKQLVWVCRTLSTMLDAGLPIVRVLDVLGGQVRSPGARRAFSRTRARIEQGATLAEALGEQGVFPELFITLVGAGEESGMLERTTAELARYYEFRQRLRSHFLARITLPVLQYVAAVAVVSIALHIIRTLLGGPSHVFLWLGLGYGIPAALVGLYWLAARAAGASRLCHEIILRVPVLGNVARALALARFSLVLHLLYEAGFPIMAALRRALEGTGNAAFAARADVAVASIEGSGNLTDALRATGLFPREYLDIAAVAEEAGKLEERLDWLAAHYAERSESALKALAALLTWVVWGGVAAFIIYYIFVLFRGYLAALGGAIR